MKQKADKQQEKQASRHDTHLEADLATSQASVLRSRKGANRRRMNGSADLANSVNGVANTLDGLEI
jgi:hypothetical protein